jgi:hypothetical protein
VKECSFEEERVPPGTLVCAIGVWSADEGSLHATPSQELWLYAGSPAAVREVLKSSSGCGAGFAWIVTAAVIATLISLILSR